MKHKSFYTALLLLVFSLSASRVFSETDDLTDQVKQSLVYLEISNVTYGQYQPWKQTDISKESGYGCAVSDRTILTTAENVKNATLIQAKVYGQNTYIPATVKVVDYEYNLCLLEVDPNRIDRPLKPIQFTESYPKGESLRTYWLSGSDHLTTARSTLDRAEMNASPVSFVPILTFFASNVSRPFGDGELVSHGKDFIGLAYWGSDNESGVIPSETIQRFLKQASKVPYRGFATAGFETYNLLDPTMRRYLKMPPSLKNGVYVSSVYSLGTGSEELKHGDVILSIDGKTLNAYGRYEHPDYERISFHHIILQHPVSDKIPFEIFRDGKIMNIDVTAKSIRSSDMLVPYYIYGKQPEYVMTGGFVFQQLTRDYLTLWGKDWAGKTPPHLMHYYSDLSMHPTPDRSQIIVLNYVLPTPMNLGYQDMTRLVVKSVNGTKVGSMKDFYNALTSQTDSDYITVEFELDSPTLVIPKKNLNMINYQIAKIYGIPKLVNIPQ